MSKIEIPLNVAKASIIERALTSEEVKIILDYCTTYEKTILLITYQESYKLGKADELFKLI